MQFSHTCKRDLIKMYSCKLHSPVIILYNNDGDTHGKHIHVHTQTQNKSTYVLMLRWYILVPKILHYTQQSLAIKKSTMNIIAGLLY